MEIVDVSHITVLSALVTYSLASYNFQGKEKYFSYRGKRTPSDYSNRDYEGKY